MSIFKKGQRPADERTPMGSAPINPDHLFGNQLAIPPSIAKQLKADGKEVRWVRYDDLRNNDGMHKKQWIPYTREGETDIVDWYRGKGVEGLVRRGDLVLAYKAKEDADRHRAYLDQRAQAQSGKRKHNANALRTMAREAGSTVAEGYDSQETS